MNPSTHLEILARTVDTLGRTPDGRLVATAPIDLTESEEADLVLAIAATGTGHRWATCPTCGQDQLIGSAHGCHLTPRCTGRLKATRRKDPPPLADGLGCCRPGCTTPAHHLTAGLEPVCHLDFLHLALLQQEHDR